MACRPSGGAVDRLGLERTMYWIKEIGLRKFAYVPEMKEFNFITERYSGILTLVEDLRRENQFQVEDFHSFDLSRLRNGKKLSQRYKSSIDVIKEKEASGTIEIRPDGHGTIDDSFEALEHMFLIQHNGKNGRLILGDLDHLIIAEKGFQYGIVPEYLK